MQFIYNVMHSRECGINKKQTLNNVLQSKKVFEPQKEEKKDSAFEQSTYNTNTRRFAFNQKLLARSCLKFIREFYSFLLFHFIYLALMCSFFFCIFSVFFFCFISLCGEAQNCRDVLMLKGGYLIFWNVSLLSSPFFSFRYILLYNMILWIQRN